MNRIAFLFGSNGPPGPRQLKYALNDVERLRAVFKGERCGFKVTVASRDSDPYDLQREIDALASQCLPDDVFLVYFSGHGAIQGGELYLELDDTREQLFPTAFLARRVLDSFRMCQAGNKLLILDCCHAGGAVSGVKDGRGTPVEDLVSSRNHLVLFAGDRLEKAREFENLGGSFLAQAIVDTLSDPAARGVVLSQLMKSLEEAAAKHNRGKKLDDRVPIPYLFGEQKGEFPIALPDSRKVIVVFRRNEEPDIALLLRTFSTFNRWNSSAVRTELPIEIEFPPFVKTRLGTLRRMIAGNEWPRPETMSDEAVKQGKRFIDQTVSSFKLEMASGVRDVLSSMMTEAINDTGLQPGTLEVVLRHYLVAKMLVLIRLLISFRYNGETPELWLRDYAYLDQTWSNQLFGGFPIIYQESHPSTLFWGDADLRLGSAINRPAIRVFLPDWLAIRTVDHNNVPSAELVTALAPQLVVEDDAVQSRLPDLFRDIHWKRLSIARRNETFISTDSFNFPDGNTPTKKRLVRRVAASIAERSPGEKPDQLRSFLWQQASSFPFLDGLLEEVQRRCLPGEAISPGKKRQGRKRSPG